MEGLPSNLCYLISLSTTCKFNGQLNKLKKMNSNSDKKQSHNELKSDDNSNEQEIKDFEFQGINSQNSEINKDNNDIINTDNKNTETNDEPIYVMTLALEQGKSEKIEIFANSTGCFVLESI